MFAFNRPLFNDNINDTLVRIAKEQGNRNAWKQNPGPSAGITPSWAGGTDYWSNTAIWTPGGSSNVSYGAPAAPQPINVSYGAPAAPQPIYVAPTSDYVETPQTSQAFSRPSNVSAVPSMFGQENLPLYGLMDKNNEKIEQGKNTRTLNTVTGSNLLDGIAGKLVTGAVGNLLNLKDNTGYYSADDPMEQNQQAEGIVFESVPDTFSEDWWKFTLGDKDTLRKYGSYVQSDLSPQQQLGMFFGDTESMKDYPYANPVDIVGESMQQQAGRIANARNILFDTPNAEYAMNIDGRDYTEDQIRKIRNQTPENIRVDSDAEADFVGFYTDQDGNVYSEDDVFNVSTAPYRYVDYRVEEPDAYIEDPEYGTVGIKYVTEVTLNDGRIIPLDTFASLQYNYIPISEANVEQRRDGTYYKGIYRDDEGNEIRYADLESSFDPENYRQLNSTLTVPLFGVELSGLNKANPESPLENPKDIIPWLADAALTSVPWMLPGVRMAKAGADLNSAIDGNDINKYNYRTREYGTDELTGIAQAAALAMPAVEILTENMGGWLAEGAANAAKDAMRSAAYRVGKGMAQEGIEEVVATPFEMANQIDDWNEFGADYTQNDDGTLTYETSTPWTDRVQNIAKNAAENFIAGALIGGPLVAAPEASSWIRTAPQRGGLFSRDYADLRDLDYVEANEDVRSDMLRRYNEYLERNDEEEE